MMHRGKRNIFLLTVLLAALLLFSAVQMESADVMDLSLSFQVGSEMTNETVRSWKNPEGKYFVFLPGYAQMDQVWAVSGSGSISIDGRELSGNMRCDPYELNKTYSLTADKDGRTLESTITFVRAENIPAMYVDVSSGNMAYIHQDKTNEETGELRIYGTDGAVLYSGMLASVKGRGNSSWGADKKPYNLTLHEDADLLGMGAARNWILLAEGYNSWPIRNKIVYDFAASLSMPYTPGSEWVNLYLNGEYAGLYLLSERNEIHPERIAVPEEGSFVVSMENRSSLEEQKLPYIAIEDAQAFRIRYGSAGEQELSEVWSALHNALYAEDGTDPVTGKHWQDLIDMDSWVRKYLIEEVFANADGGVLSQYFYADGADPQGMICAGPVWDYDYAMGGEDFWLKEYSSYLVLAREYIYNETKLPWYYKLYQKEAFYKRLVELFETEFCPRLKELTESGIDDYVHKTEASALCDGIRWDHSEQEVRADGFLVKTFLQKRLEFLTDLWLNDSEFHIVRVEMTAFTDGYLAVRDGDTLPVLPLPEEIGGTGWFRKDTEEPFDVTMPIYEDLHLYVKKKDNAIPRIHYVPLAVVVLVLPGLMTVNTIRTKKNGGEK